MEQKDLDYFKNLLNNMLTEAQQKGDSTLEDMTDNNEMFADPADRAALQRMENGTFGYCESCGDDIGVARLKARPVTRLCINCKSKQEEDEQVRGD